MELVRYAVMSIVIFSRFFVVDSCQDIAVFVIRETFAVFAVRDEIAALVVLERALAISLKPSVGVEFIGDSFGPAGFQLQCFFGDQFRCFRAVCGVLQISGEDILVVTISDHAGLEPLKTIVCLLVCSDVAVLENVL